MFLLKYILQFIFNSIDERLKVMKTIAIMTNKEIRKKKKIYKIVY